MTTLGRPGERKRSLTGCVKNERIALGMSAIFWRPEGHDLARKSERRYGYHRIQRTASGSLPVIRQMWISLDELRDLYLAMTREKLEQEIKREEEPWHLALCEPTT